MVRQRTECVAYAARSVHGGSKPPPYGTPYAVPRVCNANFQDALHPYSHHKGRLTLRCLRRLVLPIVLVIVSFYIETAGGVLGNIVARVMTLEGAPLYLGTVTVSVRSEMYTASASWHMYFSFRLFMIAWAVQLRTMCVAYTAAPRHRPTVQPPAVCVAYTAGEIPTLCVALRIRLRALPSAQDDISPALQPFSLAPRCQHIELRSNISSA